MSFGLSLPVIVAGALALAAILYLLQRLRVRRQVVRLPAAALWQQAAREAPSRALGPRFRHWPAYLLALAIALTLWLAAAHPTMSASGGGTRIFYLDLSAALTGDGDAARAKRALLADVRSTPAAGRAVHLGDDTGTLLLAPGESASLLAGRLDGIAAAARASTFGDWAGAAATRLPEGATVRYYGSRATARSAAGRLPPALRLEYGFLAEPVAGNRGIVALGASPAASGRWSMADVLVEVAGGAAAALSPDALRWTLDGAPFVPDHVTRAGRHALLLRDVTATGGLLRVALRRGDDFPADDAAALRLPDRRPIRVAVAAGVPATVRDAIRADDGFVLTDIAQAAIVVRRAGDAAGAALPALVLSAPARQEPAFLFSAPGEAEGGDLATRLDELGLARLDAAALADELQRPISIAVAPASRRSVAVWADLFAPHSSFARSAAMPLFTSAALRWLGGADGWVPYAKAGATLPDQSRLYGLTGRAAADTGGPDERGVAMSLTDRQTSMAASDTRPGPTVSPIGGNAAPDRPFLLLLLAAGLLLAVEWWLFQRGRMP